MKSGKRAQATHKRQHFVPKSYLASWTDPGTPSGQEPYVHLLTKDGSGYRRKAPAKIFRETDLYTIRMAGGLRDLTLEHGLSQLEDSFMQVVREFIVPQRLLPTIHRLKLMLFVAALHARTLKMRDHHSAQWKRLLNIAERGAPEDGRIEWLDGTSDSEAPSYIHVDDIRELVENPMPTTVPAGIDAETPLMWQMHARILCIESETGFITSESPVVWMNAQKVQSQEARFWGPSFIDKELEITVPLTPTRALLLRHGTPGIDYMEVPDKAMRMLNARTRHYANNETVSRLGYYEPLCLQDLSLRMAVSGAGYVRHRPAPSRPDGPGCRCAGRTRTIRRPTRRAATPGRERQPWPAPRHIGRYRTSRSVRRARSAGGSCARGSDPSGSGTAQNVDAVEIRQVRLHGASAPQNGISPSGRDRHPQ